MAYHKKGRSFPAEHQDLYFFFLYDIHVVLLPQLTYVMHVRDVLL